MNTVIWLILMAVFLIVEAATVAMVSLWFAIGALAAVVISLLGGELWLQALVFFLLSGALLAALRPLARKYFTPKLTRTNVDSIIGTQGIVTANIHNVEATGQVKLASMEWTARSTSGYPIPAGTRVKVDRVEGVKVFVSPVEVTAKV
ncbi:MAG TPA: NfeD family protein [Candidatus Faecousia intestinigallinarum]|nr:NfeD family protein [Candidatus Faecousia intestinigallinarum]